MRLVKAAVLFGMVCSTFVAKSISAQSPDSKPRVLDRIVAIVNDDIILRSEVARRLSQLAPNFSNISDPLERARRRAQFTEQVLEEMINDALIVQEAKDARLKVKPQEIRTTLEQLKKQNGLDDEQLAEALALQGYTVRSYQEELRQQLLRARAINTFVRPKVQVTTEAMQARYKEMNQRTGTASQVHLYHILVGVAASASAEVVKAARSRAAMIIEKARSGEPFSKLAREFSDDADTKESGGELGWIEKGSIASDWEAVVFAMDKGQIRGPIKGVHGFHIFQVTDTKTEKAKPFDEVKGELKKQLQRLELEKQTQTWIKDLRTKAYIKKNGPK